VTAAGSVIVVNIDVDLLANGTSDVELNRPCITDQIRCHVNFHAVVTNDSVRRQILALEVHVDRHIVFRATSTDRRNKIDGCDATTFLDQRDGIGSDE
jgi:hypothetical protein